MKMNSLLWGSVSTAALLLAIAPTVRATTIGQATNAVSIAANIQQTSPVDLVGLARQGYLAQQGVPSGGDLIFAAQANQITPEEVVQAGIKAGRVAPETLQDQGYLNVVANQLYDLVTFSVSE
ncbi:MAG: hypothetical protein KME42_05540 [Tildeniella nuda ZEHNDER 1965/U140]|jgi:hypothetical protein|nr:hypothetical protein [Tildeniella nuda ZEHNDER 1965/U140]